MSTIYEVVEHDFMLRFYFYATKREALDHVRKFEPAFDGATCEIRPLKVEITKRGMVEELNFLIEKTCFNEG